MVDKTKMYESGKEEIVDWKKWKYKGYNFEFKSVCVGKAPDGYSLSVNSGHLW